MTAIKTVKPKFEKRSAQYSGGSSHRESESGVTARPVAAYHGHGRVSASRHIELPVGRLPITIQQESLMGSVALHCRFLGLHFVESSLP